MEKIDKTNLLFEYLLGPDKVVVSKKIEDIQHSQEYRNLSGIVDSLSKSQLLNDVVERFQKIDIYSIMSLKKAIEVEKELKELNSRVEKFTPVNPYLGSGAEKEYGVKNIGNVEVEINSETMELNEFLTKSGVDKENKKKIVKLKSIGWYKEAKANIARNMSELKLMLKKVKRSKLNYVSLTLQYILAALSTVALVAFAIACPVMAKYRAGTYSLPVNAYIFSSVVYVSVIGLGLLTIIFKHIKTYPFRVSSTVRKTIIKQKKLDRKLDVVSDSFERKLVEKAHNAKELNKVIKSVAIVGNEKKFSSDELLEYLYNEKQYYYTKHKGLLVVYNVLFVLTFLSSLVMLVLASTLMF